MTGGYDGSYIKSVETISGEKDDACRVADMPEGRRGHASFQEDGKLFSCGGRADGLGYTDTCLSYDPVRGEWKPEAKLTTKWRYYASFVKVDGKSCLMGGWSDDGAKNSIECYNKASGWSLLPERIPGAGIFLSCAVTLPNKIIVTGGASSG